MENTTIISTSIDELQWADGWPILLGSHQVLRPSVWLVDPVRTHKRLANRYVHILHNDELARAARFHHPAHQVRYKTTHSVLRMLLASTTKINAENLRFVREHHNKPSLTTDQGGSIAFNLSYTEGKSIVGIADGTAIGIDIEWSRRPIGIDDMLEACFSANEINYITSQQHGMRSRFFTLWTRKEAILKLTGEGIGEHLPFFEVLDGSCVAEKKTIGGNPPDRIYLYSFHFGDGYVGCYATSEPLNRLPVYQL